MISRQAEGQQRQPPVDGEHHDSHDGQRKEVVDNREDAAGEHLVDGIHVRGDARDQPPHGVRVEKTYVHALHMTEDVAAQVEHDLLTGPLHQVRLHKFEQVGRDLSNQENQRQPGNALHGVRRQMPKQQAGRAAFVAEQSRA